MTQPPHLPQQHQGIGLNDVRKLLDKQLVNTGIPGAMVGVGITRAVEGKGWQCLIWTVTAAGVWLFIKVGRQIAAKIDQAIEKTDKQVSKKIELARINRSDFHRHYLEALKTHCYNLKVEGDKGHLPRLVLEEVYLPLRVDAGS